MIDLNKDLKKKTYTGIEKIDGGDNVCILSGRKIQVVQPKYGSTAGFQGMTDIPHFHVVIVIDYLAVGSGSAPGDWAVMPSMYGTHLKHGQYF